MRSQISVQEKSCQGKMSVFCLLTHFGHFCIVTCNIPVAVTRMCLMWVMKHGYESIAESREK